MKWFIEAKLEGRRVLRRIAIQPLPFRIGRSPNVELTVQDASVSAVHAEIVMTATGPAVRDLGSTNGSFLNEARIESEMPIDDGDILHFGGMECRVVREVITADPSSTMELSLEETGLPHQLPTGTGHLRRLLTDRAVTMHYQPIVALRTEETFAFEALGRGNVDGLSPSPVNLFRLAREMNCEARLSCLFRDEGVRSARALPGDLPLFLNTHPAEMQGPELMTSLNRLRRDHPGRPMNVEIHESAVADSSSIAELRDALVDLKIGLAYDDFGAGQSRLLEMADVPPDFLKFDMSFIRDIDQAPESRQSVLATLVGMATDMGIRCVAEGIETAGEARACIQLGFELGQGYLYGSPQPPDNFLS